VILSSEGEGARQKDLGKTGHGLTPPKAFPLLKKDSEGKARGESEVKGEVTDVTWPGGKKDGTEGERKKNRVEARTWVPNSRALEANIHKKDGGICRVSAEGRKAALCTMSLAFLRGSEKIGYLCSRNDAAGMKKRREVMLGCMGRGGGGVGLGREGAEREQGERSHRNRRGAQLPPRRRHGSAEKTGEERLWSVVVPSGTIRKGRRGGITYTDGQRGRLENCCEKGGTLKDCN